MAVDARHIDCHRNGAAKGGTAYELAGWIPEVLWIMLVIGIVIAGAMKPEPPPTCGSPAAVPWPP
jgi:hypothetical protein